MFQKLKLLKQLLILISLRNLRKRSKELLSVLVVFLFVGNFYICEFFNKYDIDKWWDLRLNIYACLFALCLYIARIDTKGILRFILSIGVGFSVSDVVDRVFFNITVFTKTDILMILTTIIISYIELCQHRKLIH